MTIQPGFARLRRENSGSRTGKFIPHADTYCKTHAYSRTNAYSEVTAQLRPGLERNPDYVAVLLQI